MLLLAGCGDNPESASESESRVLSGQVTLVSSERGASPEISSEYSNAVTISDEHEYACRGSGGYSDHREGTQVTVRDGDGATLGVGRLSVGEFGAINRETGEPIEDLDTFRDSDDEFDRHGNYNYRGFCVFTFTVELPAEDRDFYGIQVANRNELTHSHEELETAGWEVSLTLGGH